MSDCDCNSNLGNNRFFFIYLIAVIIAALIGWYFTSQGVTSAWFQNLNKPSIMAPNWVFGVVWIILFLLLAYAGFRGDIAFRGDRGGRIAWNVLFTVVILLSIAWPLVFYTAKNIMAGFWVIILYLIIVIAMMSMVGKRDKAVSFLLLPLGLWLIYAAVLNYQYATVNGTSVVSLPK